MRRLIFVRHGIRGVPIHNRKQVPFFNTEKNLSLQGHIKSYEMGKFIYNTYGKPTLIYPDVRTERTIATGIAIAKGSGQHQIALPETKIDPYFFADIKCTKADKKTQKG